MYLAHAFGQRYELPLPLLFFVIGGAVVVFASFLLVLRRPADGSEVGEPTADPAPLSHFRPVPAGLGLACLIGLVAAGIGGTQEVAENILPTAFWLVIWIAVPLSVGLIGDWTRQLNPLATLARLADSATARRALLGDAAPLAWPRWLSWWPAVVTFFVVACGELVFNQWATVLRVTAYGLVGLAALGVLAGFFFGAPAWVHRGEMFSVLFATWAGWVGGASVLPASVGSVVAWWCRSSRCPPGSCLC